MVDADLCRSHVQDAMAISRGGAVKSRTGSGARPVRWTAATAAVTVSGSPAASLGADPWVAGAAPIMPAVTSCGPATTVEQAPWLVDWPAWPATGRPTACRTAVAG